MPIHNYPSIRAVPVLLLINDPLAPPQAWVQFADRLEDLAQPEKLESALSCLNLLVTDALKHVPDVLTYLARLRNQSIFNFCAIPQVGGRLPWWPWWRGFISHPTPTTGDCHACEGG